jgi:hypothetical protein
VKTIVIISDLQAPYHDVGATDTLAKFIKAYKPDEVVSVGDEIDFPQISRWEEGYGGEWKYDIGKHRDITVRLLESLNIKPQ